MCGVVRLSISSLTAHTAGRGLDRDVGNVRPSVWCSASRPRSGPVHHPARQSRPTSVIGRLLGNSQNQTFAVLTHWQECAQGGRSRLRCRTSIADIPTLILSLLDQVYDPRAGLRAVPRAVDAQPSPVRDAILAAIDR